MKHKTEVGYVWCEKDFQQDSKWQMRLVIVASILFGAVAVWGLANAVVTFPEAIAEYDSQYAEVTGQK